MRFVYLIALRFFFLSFSFVVRQFVSLCGPLDYSQSALSGHDSSNFHFVIDEIISTYLFGCCDAIARKRVCLYYARERERENGGRYIRVFRNESARME